MGGGDGESGEGYGWGRARGGRSERVGGRSEGSWRGTKYGECVGDRR